MPKHAATNDKDVYRYILLGDTRVPQTLAKYLINTSYFSQQAQQAASKPAHPPKRKSPPRHNEPLGKMGVRAFRSPACQGIFYQQTSYHSPPALPITMPCLHPDVAICLLQLPPSSSQAQCADAGGNGWRCNMQTHATAKKLYSGKCEGN